MKTFFGILKNPGIWLSILNTFLIVFIDKILNFLGILKSSPNFVAVLVSMVFLVLTLIYYWYSSMRPVNYETVSECLSDIMSDVLSILIILITIFLWFIWKPIENLDFVRYYTIFAFLTLMCLANLFELYVTTKNSLEAMYRRNPISITS